MNSHDIENHIRKRFYDKLFDVKSLAAELNISESYLREIINLNYNCSPHHLIETIRVEAEIKLLCEKDIKIYLVCSKTGYANLKTFRRAFKKRTGMTPNEFREMIRKYEDVDNEVQKIINYIWNHNI